MKTIILLLAFVSSAFSQTAFNGHAVEWGWSGAGGYSKQTVVDILTKNGPNADKLSLQAQVDAVTQAEFLWKITADQVAQADKTASSYIVGGIQASSLIITFEPNGKGEIRLYSQADLVGRVRCWTSSKRTGVKYTQLAEGNYTVTGTNRNGWSNEFKCKMPNQIEMDGSARTRGIKIHTGDISGEKPGINEYHGCIRVSEPVGREFMKVVQFGTTIKVVWN
jgi:hypothetical protein